MRGNILEAYDLGKQLGRGHFGVVRVCTEKATGKRYAVKSVAKTPKSTREQIMFEVSVMFRAGRHPGVVYLKEIFEDATCIYLVMELLEGRDLLAYGFCFTELMPSQRQVSRLCIFTRLCIICYAGILSITRVIIIKCVHHKCSRN